MNNKKKAQAKLISVHVGHTAFLCLTASSLAGRDRKGQEGTGRDTRAAAEVP